ncbi:hypothetical protein SeLEV6574_g00110 [Synchytrium endobioticum]|uniref:CBS domain-containing protein n=1 Tax=Synchytrium endobioticum TaxID=286115 RepID=A0A507DKJ4_9FUNG|nr:hypothetical protein SeLEV6574_g00110 [Synchytrium endobioticum]
MPHFSSAENIASANDVDEVEVVTVPATTISLNRHSNHEQPTSIAILPQRHANSPNEVTNPASVYPDYRDIPVRRLMKIGLVITIDAKAPVAQAFELLVKHHISSIPITQDGQILGIIDFHDILNFILSEIDNPAKPDKHSSVKDLLGRSRLGTISQSTYSSSTSSVTSVQDDSVASLDQRRDKLLYAFSPDAPLRDVLDLFGNGVHRAIVYLDAPSSPPIPPSSPANTSRVSPTAPTGKYGIISQSTVIKYIFNNSRFYPELTRQLTSTVKDLGLGTPSVMTVDSEAPLVDALRMMAKQQVSSLGIVDKRGVLLSNLSLGDMKWVIQARTPQFLYDSVMQFRTQVDRLSGIDDGLDVIPVFDITECATLGYAMSKVMATKTHRVWVVDHARKPKIVISLTDMIRHFFEKGM